MKDSTKIKWVIGTFTAILATTYIIRQRAKAKDPKQPAQNPVKPNMGNGFVADGGIDLGPGFNVTTPADPITTPLPLPTPIRTPEPAPVPDPVPVRNEPVTKPVHNNVFDPPKPPINTGGGYQTGNTNLFTDDSNTGTWENENPIGMGGIQGLTRDLGIFR